MNDLAILLGLQARGARVILLRAKAKLPAGTKHTIAKDADEVVRWIEKGNNVGITGGPSIAILDFDVPAAEEEMLHTLGPLPATVETGSGKRHYYVGGDPTFPGKIRSLDGEMIVGDLRRTTQEYVVAPPSIHPNGKPYTFLAEPMLKPLPKAWLAHLKRQPRSDGTGAEFEIPTKILEGERHRVLHRWIRSLKASSGCPGLPAHDAYCEHAAAARNLLWVVNGGLGARPPFIPEVEHPNPRGGAEPLVRRVGCVPPIGKDWSSWFERAWNAGDRPGWAEGKWTFVDRKRTDAERTATIIQSGIDW